MIHSFSCKNFCSFRDKTTLSFEVDKKAPKNDSYVQTKNGRFSKIEVIIGANASGKTNLMKVLPFLKWIIVDSFSDEPNSFIPVDEFIFKKDTNLPTEISAVFEIQNSVYTYFVKLTRDRIVLENLFVSSKTTKRVTQKKVFEREWDTQNHTYNFDDRKYKFPKGTKDLLRSNSSLIASAVRTNHKLSQDISNNWKKLNTNVTKIGFVDLNNNLTSALMTYLQDAQLKRDVEKLLNRFDLGVNGIVVDKKRDDSGRMQLGGHLTHLINGVEYSLPLDNESSGTKRLMVLLKSILRVLRYGGVAILDEIDVNLHPEIVSSVVSLFENKYTNPTNAQILFSTHSHIILNRLDKYQIILTEKKENGKTIAWRLDQNPNVVRSDENFYAKYITGVYGAIPKIDL